MTTSPSTNDAFILIGSGDRLVDASGNSWTITSGAQVAINGVTDTTTSAVTGLAYVNGVIWQENVERLWWSCPTATAGVWTPSSGTATSPLPPPPTAASIANSISTLAASLTTALNTLKGIVAALSKLSA